MGGQEKLDWGMDMKKRLTILAIVATLTGLMLLSACGGGDELKGTWEGQSDDFGVTWVFDGKGGCTLENEYGFNQDGEYSIDGSSLTIKMSAWDTEHGYKFKIDGNKLTLTADDPYVPNYELEKK